jgi:histidine phosphotransferase ChpT
VLPLLKGEAAESVDAHKIQPFYAGLLARECGLNVTMTAEADSVIVAAG